MLARSFALLLALGAWSAALQFAARPAISAVPLLPAIAIHTLPPLALWIGWLAMRWRASLLEQKQSEQRAAEETARREAERTAARQRHEEELRQRRFHCNCRTLVISAANLEAFPLVDALPPNVDISVVDHDTASGACITLQRLRPAITNVLAFVYSSCPAAAWLPIYIAPPADIPANEVLELIRAVRAELMEPAEDQAAIDDAPVLFLPVASTASNSVLALFENASDLPGATVLAFDSPLSRLSSDENNEESHRYPHQYPGGVPNEGAVALFVTHPELPRMLDAVSDLTPEPLEDKALTPFWDRTTVPDGLSLLLVRMHPALRTELGALPTLGHIHRASLAESGNDRSGILEMTRMFQGLLEHAQVDTALLDKPFTLEDAPAADADTSVQRPQCARLVHNAGNTGTGGKRLAALGSAMLYFGIDFSPVNPDVATNTIACLGDLGCAAGAARLALSIAHAAESRAPVLCAEFTDQGGVALSIAMPSATPA